MTYDHRQAHPNCRPWPKSRWARFRQSRLSGNSVDFDRKTTKTRSHVMICAIALSVLGAKSAVEAAEITAISPASAIGTEGDQTVFGGRGPARVQLLYLAEDFASVPSTHRTITGFAWRPDAMSTSITDPIAVEARFRLSSTPVDELGATFAANRGPDGGPVVFDGTLTFQTDNQPPGPGPRNFDHAFEFQQVFDYDPSQGENLLLEFEVLAEASSVDDWFIDAISTSGQFTGLSASSLAATAGTQREGAWPAEFTFVPEPSSWLSCLSALAGLNMKQRRRRRA